MKDISRNTNTHINTYYMFYQFYENGTYQLYTDINNERYLIETGEYQYMSSYEKLVLKNRIRSEFAKENFDNNNTSDTANGCEIKGNIMKLIYRDGTEVYNRI